MIMIGGWLELYFLSLESILSQFVPTLRAILSISLLVVCRVVTGAMASGDW